MIVGLCGYARSGKDETAKVLVEEFGFTRIAFADKLREFMYALNPPVLSTRPGEVSTVKEVIDTYGWNGYKESEYGQHLRELIQRLGTEAGRETLWDSIWIDAALNNLNPDGRFVVCDMRFENEMNAVVDRGGVTVRIIRAGVGPVNNHPSETSLDQSNFDFKIINDGSLDDFHHKVRRFANEAGL